MPYDGLMMHTPPAPPKIGRPKRDRAKTRAQKRARKQRR